MNKGEDELAREALKRRKAYQVRCARQLSAGVCFMHRCCPSALRHSARPPVCAAAFSCCAAATLWRVADACCAHCRSKLTA